MARITVIFLVALLTTSAKANRVTPDLVLADPPGIASELSGYFDAPTSSASVRNSQALPTLQALTSVAFNGGDPQPACQFSCDIPEPAAFPTLALGLLAMFLARRALRHIRA